MNQVKIVAMVLAAAVTATAHADLAPKSNKICKPKQRTLQLKK